MPPARFAPPTRASIMTGRHPVRVEITDWIPGSSNNKKNKLLHPQDRDNLALKEVTIAEELKSHGYQTFFAGKWHLGNQGHWPTDQDLTSILEAITEVALQEVLFSMEQSVLKSKRKMSI